MNNLKKSIMGKYNAEDVDKLLKKVRNDYEQCLKEQKDRIVTLREENKELALRIEKYHANEQYIIGAITKAEQTAQSIIDEAQRTAKMKLQHVEAQEAQLRIAVEGCRERLRKLKRASESIYHTVLHTMENNGVTGGTGQPTHNLRPIKNVFESTN